MPVNTIDLNPQGGGNDGLQAEAHVTGFGRVSTETTGQSVSPAYTFESERSLGFYRSAASQIAVSNGGTVDLKTNANVLSVATAANATGLVAGQLQVVFAASGISLIYSSGASYYVIGGSATSAVQA